MESFADYQMRYKQGNYKEYSEDGVVILECNYDFDKKNGPYKEFYPNYTVK